jgi:hypothetical protein
LIWFHLIWLASMTSSLLESALTHTIMYCLFSLFLSFTCTCFSLSLSFDRARCHYRHILWPWS